MTVDSHQHSRPHGEPDPESIVVLPGRPEIARLEKRSSREDAVVVRRMQVSVETPCRGCCREMQGRRGLASKLGTEIVSIGAKLLDNGRGGSHSNIQFLNHRVVDERDAHVFVAPALTGGGIELPQQVQLGPPHLLGCLVGWCLPGWSGTGGCWFRAFGRGARLSPVGAPLALSGRGAVAGGFGKTCGLGCGYLRLTSLG